MKKILAAILVLCLLMSLAACGDNEKSETNEKTDPVKTIPTTQPVPQKEYSKQEIVELYNQAVAKVETAQSYQMDGSVSSTAVMGDMMATVVTSVDCAFASNNGNHSMLMKSSVNTDGNVKEHVTYFADGKYYFEFMGQKYYTGTNDYTDFHASEYLKHITLENVQNLAIQDEADGSRSVQFEVPYGKYPSEAINGWLGGMISDTVGAEPVSVKVVLDAQGTLINFYIAFATSMSFGEQRIDQSVIVSMFLSGYDATTVTAPSDLAVYENWDEEPVDGGGQNPDGEHDHEGEGPGLNGDYE